MKKIISLAVFHCKEKLSFRFDSLLSIFSNILSIVALYYLWNAIFGSTKTINSFTFSEIACYTVLTRMLFQLLSHDIGEVVSKKVENGDIVYLINKPTSIIVLLLTENLGYILYKFLLLVPTFFILWIIFLGGTIPANFNFLFIIPALVASYLINVSLSLIIGSISFIYQSNKGINLIKQTCLIFFSGAYIPIDFFPKTLQKICNFLPFKSIYYYPIVIVSKKNIPINHIITILCQQYLWAISLIFVSLIIWKKNYQNLEIAGG